LAAPDPNNLGYLQRADEQVVNLWFGHTTLHRIAP